MLEAIVKFAQISGEMERMSRSVIGLFVLALILMLLFMAFVVWIGWWVSSRKGSVSLYAHEPMTLGMDLAFSAVQGVEQYLQSYHQSVNPPIDLMRAAVCRKTGRIFPACVNWLGYIRLKWSFLNQRHPGRWISWGSLTPSQMAQVRERHGPIEGFQIEESSNRAKPNEIETHFAEVKPGPLYVDLETMTLLGWKSVPDTTLEVMIVQLPKFDQYVY